MADKQFSYKQLRDFIFAQPDDRPINMEENTQHATCGCVLIQFGRANDVTFTNLHTGAGFSSVGEAVAIIEDDMKVSKLIANLLANHPETYAEVKAILIEVEHRYPAIYGITSTQNTP